MIEEIVEKELSYKIIKAAFEVHNELEPGFLESIYKKTMALQLKMDGIPTATQIHIPVKYKGQLIGEHVLDILVDDRGNLELKAMSEIAPIHGQQALSYLKATGFPLDIVINFGTPRLTYRR